MLKGLSTIFLRRVIRETLMRAHPHVFRSHRTVKLDMACITDIQMARLNGEYREKSQPTDILSFGLLEGVDAIRAVPKTGIIDLGQIMLSPEFIARSAMEDGVSWEREFTYVFSHGVLHLVGFNHEDQMFDIQDVVTDSLAPLRQIRKRNDQK